MHRLRTLALAEDPGAARRRHSPFAFASLGADTFVILFVLLVRVGS